MRVYVASSWRNKRQPHIVSTLRELGHQLYDFRNPPGGTGFGWSQVDERWKNWTHEEYITQLNDPVAVAGFNSDFSAMRWADACALILPCGRSAHIEAGYFADRPHKHLYIVLDENDGTFEPELMYKLADRIFPSDAAFFTFMESA